MTKRAYLKKLKKALKGVPQREVENLLDYYRELIDDGVESGKSEKIVVGELELPEIVAENYRRAEDSYRRSEYDRRREESYRRVEDSYSRETPVSSHQKRERNVVFKVIGAILGVFVAFVGAMILFSFGVSALSVTIAGIIVFITAFGVLSTPVVGFAQIGTGILLCGIGILFFALTALLGKAYSALLRFLFDAPKKTARHTHKTAATFIVGGGICVIGLVLFLVCFGSLGFDYERLGYQDNVVEKSETIAETYDVLNFETDNLSIEIKYGEGSETRLVWHELEENGREFSYSDGKLTLKSDYDGWGSFKNLWKHGIWSAIFPSNLNEATLYLPEGYEENLMITVNNGAVKCADMKFAELSFSANNGAINAENIEADTLTAKTENGAVNISNCTAHYLHVETSNGAVRIADGNYDTIFSEARNGATMLKNLSAENIQVATRNGAVQAEYCSADTIIAETRNGAVTVNIIANNISLKTNNGAVRGTIAGKKSEFNIDARTGNGSCNLSNQTVADSDKQLTVRVENGAVNLSFSE